MLTKAGQECLQLQAPSSPLTTGKNAFNRVSAYCRSLIDNRPVFEGPNRPQYSGPHCNPMEGRGCTNERSIGDCGHHDLSNLCFVSPGRLVLTRHFL